MDQKSLIKKATGIYPEEGQKYTSPFRSDNTPGCFFSQTGKYIRFYDYAYPEFNGMTVFDMIWYLETGNRLDRKLDNFLKCLDVVKSKYGVDVNPPEYTRKPFKFILETQEAEWGRKHIKFWEDYGVTKDQLIEDGVVPIYSFTHNTKKNPDVLITKRADYPAFDYRINGKSKVYQPFGKPKWLSNHTRNDIWHWEGKKPTFVLGSYKDGRIIANTGQDTIAMGLENTLPDKLPEDSIIIGDFDKAGNNSKQRFVKEGKRALIWESPDPDFKDIGELYLKYPEKIYPFLTFAIRTAYPQ